MSVLLSKSIKKAIDYANKEIVTDKNVLISENISELNCLLTDLKKYIQNTVIDDFTALNLIEEIFKLFIRTEVKKEKITTFISLAVAGITVNNIESFSMSVFYLLIGNSSNKISKPNNEYCLREETALFEIITVAEVSQKKLLNPSKAWQIIIDQSKKTDQEIISAFEIFAEYEIYNFDIDHELIYERKVLEHLSNSLLIFLSKYQNRNIVFSKQLHEDYYHFSLYFLKKSNPEKKQNKDIN
jgi:hypothetical protein